MPVPEVCGNDYCYKTGIFVCCVAMTCGVVVTIATCRAELVVGRNRLAVQVVAVLVAELDGVCETGVWFEVCSS